LTLLGELVLVVDSIIVLKLVSVLEGLRSTKGVNSRISGSEGGTLSILKIAFL